MKLYILKKTKFIGLLIVFIAFLGSCEKKELFENNSDDKFLTENISIEYTSEHCGDIMTVDLLAGQFDDSGNIFVYNDETNLYVTYESENKWQIKAIHLFVGAENEMPVNNSGNPQIGLFPYKISFDPFVTSYTFKIPLEKLKNCFVIAAHAEVVRVEDGVVIQAETAWGEGKEISSGSWAMYFGYCVQECNPCEVEDVEYDIFAGQTIPVGTLSVTNDNKNLFVTYSSNGDWYFQKTHLYVGTLEGLPVNGNNTPIPGHFPYSNEHNPTVQSFTYTIPLNGLPKCYIIAAHAEVVKIIDGEIIQEETSWSWGTEFPDTERWGWYSSYCTQICD